MAVAVDPRNQPPVQGLGQPLQPAGGFFPADAFNELGDDWDAMQDAEGLVGRAQPLPEQPPLGAAPVDEVQEAPQGPEAPAALQPQEPAAPPAPIVQATIQPPAATVEEPTLLQKIWSVFVGVMEAFVDLILTHIFCMPRATTAAPRPAVLPAAQPAEDNGPDPIQIAPAAPGAPVLEGRVLGTLNLHPEDGGVYIDYCAREFLNTFWDQVGPDLTPAQIQPLIDQSLRNGVAKLRAQMDQGVEMEDFPRIEEIRIHRFGEVQNYAAQLNILHNNALHNPQNRAAAILIKGDAHHVILVDVRNRRDEKYYHFNPNAVPIYLQTFGTLEAIANHLNEAIPIEAEHQFRMDAYRLRAD